MTTLMAFASRLRQSETVSESVEVDLVDDRDSVKVTAQPAHSQNGSNRDHMPHMEGDGGRGASC